MKLFLIKIFYSVILPYAIIFIAIIYWDPFKVFFEYKDFYTNNQVALNREAICINYFESNKNYRQFNSFIIGSSRSNAYRIKDWEKILYESAHMKNAKGFHIDGYGLGLYRMTNIVKYLSKNTNNIENLLLILDRECFSEISAPTDHLVVEPTQVSHKSKASFYYPFIKASMNPLFVFCQIDFHYTKRYKSYMHGYISYFKYNVISNNQNGDLYYGQDREISDDSIGYYNSKIKDNEFIRSTNYLNEKDERVIGSEQLKLLKEIEQICILNHTNLKIVISPLYDQVPFNKEDKKVLTNIFGNENVYDFSGKNEFTSSISNYYEHSHYKPYVANELMKIIYANNVPK